MTGSPRGRRAGFAIRLRGLRAQIVLWTLLPLTLVLIGVAFTGVYSHERAMRTLVQERDQALAAASAVQVRDLLNQRIVALQALAAEQAFHHQRAPEQQILLDDAGTFEGLFSGAVVLVDETGALVASGSTIPGWTVDERLSSLARAVMVSQDVSLGSPLPPPSAPESILLGVPVYDDQRAAYGVLVAPVTLDGLGVESVLAQAQVGEHGIVYLVDASGRILASAPGAHARASLLGHTGLPEALEAGKAGAALCLSPEGERMTLAYAPVDPTLAGWKVLVEQPWHEVIGPVLRYSQFVPLVAALAAIVSVLTLYYGIRAIVRPLQALGERAERVAWGDFGATGEPVGGVEEIEDLRRTLDQMARRIQSYQSGMHDYIAAITRGQEEERKRLARELHDDTVQALIALGQQVEMAQNTLSSDPDRAAERLVGVRSLLGETLEGLRRFSRDLRPIYLEDLGFLPAVDMLVREADQHEELSVESTTVGNVRRLPPDLELAAYRVVQEALNNVIQHSQATHAWVEIRFDEEELLLRVRDDGQGFHPPDLPDALAREGHFGLVGIQERALLYGGHLSIDSSAAQGTEIMVRLPYPAH